MRNIEKMERDFYYYIFSKFEVFIATFATGGRREDRRKVNELYFILLIPKNLQIFVCQQNAEKCFLLLKGTI